MNQLITDIHHVTAIAGHEMINTIQIAMNEGLVYMGVTDSISTHPSMTKAFNYLYSLF